MSNLQGLGISIQGALEIIKELKGGARERLPHEQIYMAIGMIIKASARQGLYQCYRLQHDLQMVRVRHLDGSGKWFRHKDELGPLPQDKTVVYQRCHRPGRSVGYCSLHEHTALAEVKAEVKKQYAMSTFKLPAGSILLPIGEFDFFRRTEGTYLEEANEGSAKIYRDVLNGEDWIQIALFDAFFADEFMRRADSQVDYKVTSVIAEVVFHGGLPFSEPVDAFIYPSVAFRSGTNFAVRGSAYSSRLKLVPDRTRIIEVINDFGYGIYEYKDLARLKSVEKRGELNWEDI
jgi:hypothetical protein